METIFHEKQEGSLCAQHCLNALLQGHYFTAVDLAEIAQGLDERERQQMAEGGIDSDDYRQFLQQPSTNMDDSGFFSIQVISNALGVWNIDTIPYNSQDPVAATARSNPCTQNAFICNFREHWFTIRKLGHQWFNLNSLLTGPELVSDTHLKLLLAQLQQEGYSIFLIVGTLPECEADQLLMTMAAVPKVNPKLIHVAQQSSGTAGQSAGAVSQDDLQRALRQSMEDDDHLQEAMRVSMEEDSKQDKSLQSLLRLTADEAEEQELQRALQMSMEGFNATPIVNNSEELQPVNGPSLEDLREKRLAYLGNLDTSVETSPSTSKSVTPADPGWFRR
ncbi:ataxin-3-like isoform X2 [Tubulanus polymorphus]|uniref:ataxin-3-like isoform X2 n=1 Tax=Tubulanus polymorphus TaxID=672921 RepID=UPI003DA28AB1